MAKEQFNTLDKTKGMSKLFEKHQNTIINKATAFGVTVHVSLLIINLEANMEYTQSHEWGREFRVSGQAICKKYPAYTYKHDQMSYDDMVKVYVAANRVRVLREAPAPSDEQANQVRAFGGQLAALQRAFNDYEESAFSVDEDSGRSKQRRRRRRRRKTTRAAADAANIAANREDAAGRPTTAK